MPGEGLAGGKSGFRVGGVAKSLKNRSKIVKNRSRGGSWGPLGRGRICIYLRVPGFVGSGTTFWDFGVPKRG